MLIPRPETEHLVVETLDCIRQTSSGMRAVRIADIGTGSGAIAIAVAKHAPACTITAIDVSPEALAVAQCNIQRHGVEERVELVERDLFEVLSPDRRFDVIVSNPPYVSESEARALPATVRDFEPPRALVAGPEGTEVIARLIPQAAERLDAGGWFLTEISPGIEQRVRASLAHDGRFEAIATVKDLAGSARVIKARRAG